MRLSIFVNGEQVVLPASIGVQSDGSTAEAFTTDTTGTISIDAAGSVTLGEFFNTWRTDAGLAGNNTNAVLSSGQLLGNFADATHAVQMFVNGDVSTEFEDYVLSNGDEIVLVYGEEAGRVAEHELRPDRHRIVRAGNAGHRGELPELRQRRRLRQFVLSPFRDGFRHPGRWLHDHFDDLHQHGAVHRDRDRRSDSQRAGHLQLRGTVAMAKLSGDPDSATSQFFVNLSDDNTFLDLEANNSFTVFGHVLDMTTVDEIAALPIDTSNSSPYGELPLSASGQLAVIQSITGQGMLTGVKFLDANANGVRDSGESGLAGVTVFLDTDNDGVLDAGEIATTTDANGQFLLLAEPGTQTVRSLVSAGRYATLPASSEQLYHRRGRGRRDDRFVLRGSGLRSSTDGEDDNSLSGFVYLDLNGDGLRSADEPGSTGRRRHAFRHGHVRGVGQPFKNYRTTTAPTRSNLWHLVRTNSSRASLMR